MPLNRSFPPGRFSCFGSIVAGHNVHPTHFSTSFSNTLWVHMCFRSDWRLLLLLLLSPRTLSSTERLTPTTPTCQMFHALRCASNHLSFYGLIFPLLPFLVFCVDEKYGQASTDGRGGISSILLTLQFTFIRLGKVSRRMVNTMLFVVLCTFRPMAVLLQNCLVYAGLFMAYSIISSRPGVKLVEKFVNVLCFSPFSFFYKYVSCCGWMLELCRWDSLLDTQSISWLPCRTLSNLTIEPMTWSTRIKEER